ncbi:MAG: zinc-ribbon domain-containing protein, partial [Desulfobacterales bacterium]
MILTCQNCSTSFRLDESILKPSGSKVRCSRCKHIWRARPPADGGFGIDNQEAAEAKADSNTAAIAGFVAGAGVAARLAEDDQISDQTTEAEAAGTGTSSPPELKLGFDDLTTAENSDNDDNLVTDEINLDELDLLLEDEPLLPGSKPRDDFQTEELDLADLENILDDDTDASNSPPSDLPTLEADELNTIEEETDDSIMEDLDLDIDDL